MEGIGGYFELELNKNEEYHQKAIRLNTGRNAFEYILLANSYSKVYLPFFTCDVLLEPLKEHQIEYEFYYIDESFEPLFDYNLINENEAFLYTNYFGLKDSFIVQLVNYCQNLIVDSAQSFYSKPIDKVDTFYSPRKFFGVPDGAYLYIGKKLDISFEKDKSFDRCSHLLKRIDCSAEIGYEDFVHNDASLNNQDIKEMSSLTESLLSTIDYKWCAEKRKENFNFLHHKLQKTNKLKITLPLIGVPMVYPYWSDDDRLKQKLLDNKVYTATYWANVLEWSGEDSLEYQMTKQIIYLPIDQRYDEIDLKRIVDLLL
ncbi:hypothetical protein C8C85_2476 [Flavobacterium sp. 103]|uniref:hypothetical protein n=1 Tax=Flavobacterium sp. 103 TaxID=2135624 RepID=UPI000D5E94F7|nr:hypothetical protein [Flavobacterium sp. 103]PVX46611.1 hypothetical protein C8C85_2476 [Flavobacterium sp. 103]